MARMDIYKGCEVIIISRVKVIGKDENGFEYTDNTLFLQLEEPCGRRWDHNVEFDTAVKEVYEVSGNISFHSVRESAESSVESLRHRVLARGYIDDSLWNETAPRFGSDRYNIINGYL